MHQDTVLLSGQALSLKDDTLTLAECHIVNLPFRTVAAMSQTRFPISIDSPSISEKSLSSCYLCAAKRIVSLSIFAGIDSYFCVYEIRNATWEHSNNEPEIVHLYQQHIRIDNSV